MTGRIAAAALAATAGASLWLSHPPVGWWGLSFLTLPLLLAALAVAPGVSDRRALGLGVLAGVVAYGPMLWWLVYPAGVAAWVLLVVIQAGWMGLAAVPMGRVVDRPWIALVAPVAWLAMDAWRAVVPLGGFGWGSIAYAHAGDPWLLPVARLLGGRGITAAVVIPGALAVAAVVGVRSAYVRTGGPWPERLAAAVPAAQAPLLGLGAVLLAVTVTTVAPPPASGEALDVVAVQGNDRPAGVSGAAEDRAIAERMLRQTRRAVAAGGRPDLTVWPESSIDRDPADPSAADLRRILGEAARVVGGDLLAGMNLRGPDPGTFRNTTVHLDRGARRTGIYTKRRLVPFGEYVPLRPLLGDLPPLRRVPRDAVAGTAATSLAVAGTRIAPAICFETLFPGLVRSNVLAGTEPAGLVLATTNDASFGRSAEPAQHLAQSRIRAVETGRWVVHAALSGSSAFVDPSGGVHQPTALFTQTWIRRRLPVVAAPTVFLRIGDVVGWIGRAAGLGLVLWVGLDRRRRGPDPSGRRPDRRQP